MSPFSWGRGGGILNYIQLSFQCFTCKYCCSGLLDVDKRREAPSEAALL